MKMLTLIPDFMK